MKQASIISLHIGPVASRRLYTQATKCLDSSNHALAASLYRASFEADRDNIQALIMLGVCHYKLDDYQTATGLFREALTLAPFDAAAHYYLGMCRAQAGASRRAILCYQRAVMHAPQFCEAWFALSVAWSHEGNQEMSRAAMSNFERYATSQQKRAVKGICDVDLTAD
jgi:tetratricopeptide (TPR) repeat protein